MYIIINRIDYKIHVPIINVPIDARKYFCILKTEFLEHLMSYMVVSMMSEVETPIQELDAFLGFPPV